PPPTAPPARAPRAATTSPPHQRDGRPTRKGHGPRPPPPPQLRTLRHDEQRSAASMRAHRNCQLNERVDRVGGRGERAGSEQRADQKRTVRQTGAVFIHYLYLVPLEHRDVVELAGFLSPPLLAHRQAGC